MLDFSIDQTCLTKQIEIEGANSHKVLLDFFNKSALDDEIGLSAVVDYWSSWHEQNFLLWDFRMWSKRKLGVVQLSVAITRPRSGNTWCLIYSQTFRLNHGYWRFISASSIFCTDNEAKMKAAFDGRYSSGYKLGGRIGCVEYALSVSVKYCFETNVNELWDCLLNKLTTVEKF